MAGLLLDTCALWWLTKGEKIAPASLGRIYEAQKENSLYLSPISAWEVALQCAKKRFHLTISVTQWWQNLAQQGFSILPLSAEILVASVELPGQLHGDPADRILIATARHYRVPLLTRDRHILAYGRKNHVKAFAC